MVSGGRWANRGGRYAEAFGPPRPAVFFGELPELRTAYLLGEEQQVATRPILAPSSHISPGRRSMQRERSRFGRAAKGLPAKVIVTRFASGVRATRISSSSANCAQKRAPQLSGMDASLS